MYYVWSWDEMEGPRWKDGLIEESLRDVKVGTYESGHWKVDCR